jgi:hypothetical protein
VNPADCPFKPGTPEWKDWQAEAIRAESRTRHETGEYGVTPEAKQAAGLAATETVRGNQLRGGRRLDSYAEPWRTEIVEALQQPRPMFDPLMCPWCHRRYIQRAAHSKHVARCGHWSRIDSPEYTSGDYVPLVASGPWRIVGSVASDEALEQWAQEDDEARRTRARLVDRYGADIVRAVAIRLGSKKHPAVGEALEVLAIVEAHGWRPPEPT